MDCLRFFDRNGLVFFTMDDQKRNGQMLHRPFYAEKILIGLIIFVELKVVWKLLLCSTVLNISDASFFPFFEIFGILLKTRFKIAYGRPSYNLVNAIVVFRFY